jgi:hypothetical protein
MANRYTHLGDDFNDAMAGSARRLPRMPSGGRPGSRRTHGTCAIGRCSGSGCSRSYRVRPCGGRTDDIAHTLAPQAGVGKQGTDRFVKLVVIGLGYWIMVSLFRSLLVPVVILFALPSRCRWP